MITKFKQFVILFTIIATLFGCATKEESDPYMGYPASQLFRDGQQAVADGKFRKAIQIFESYDSQYPLDENAEQALVEYIYAQYKADEHALAVAIADRYIKLYPRSSNIDYVYYLKGMINSEQERTFFDRYVPSDLSYRDVTYFKEAYRDFSYLVRHYPKSPYVSDAKQRMIFLRNLIAQSELNIAKFYFERTQYVAAINRAMEVTEFFPQSSQAKEALEIIEKANRKIGTFESASDAKRISQANFPKS